MRTSLRPATSAGRGKEGEREAIGAPLEQGGSPCSRPGTRREALAAEGGGAPEAAKAHSLNAAELQTELQQAEQKLAAEKRLVDQLREKLARRNERLEEAALQLRRAHPPPCRPSSTCALVGNV